jgi:hypothetical protein
MRINMKMVVRGGLGLGLGLWLAGCTEPKTSDEELARQVTEVLTSSCPMASPADEDARALCASHLSDDKFLPSVMQEPFLWGGQTAGTSYHLEESNMNRFNVFVWRRMYLSLMMVPGQMSIEQTADGLTVVHLPYQFRNELEIGSYPYPFWHSKKKWDSYQFSREMVLVFQNGKWIGAMRAADQDTSRPQVAHTWSGQWHWEKDGDQMPYVSLYTYLLSAQNPNTTRLDNAYRALSDGMRQQSCLMCHSPDNFAASKQLEFFNYPNQALYSRNTIIGHLEKNTMPPLVNALGLAPGIQDETERQELLTLAREFKAAGDDALAFESELKPVD